jgi:argininosuccinate lyase
MKKTDQPLATGTPDKLWGGHGLDPQIERFTVGNDTILDQRLVPYDCLGSMAHARMLGAVGLLEASDVRLLLQGLEEIIALSKNGAFTISAGQEDCHTAIEQWLVDKLGDAGKRIHLGRSRNDQVLTALRLYYKDALVQILAEVAQLRECVQSFCRRHQRTPMPGFTHMRKAMPSSVGAWGGALADALADDALSLQVALQLMDQCPLGSGAGYGVPLPLDRQMTADELGFAKVQDNPIYVQLSRGKFETTLVHALSQVLLDLNRTATDLVFFSMPEFNYFALPTELCTGSSIMPQKQNPDVLELVRGKYHLVVACENQLRGTLANMPHGYHRDLQLTKEPTFRAIDTTRETVGIMTLVFQRLSVNMDALKAAMTPELYATQEAYKLVTEEGMSFREAYAQVKRELP